MKKIFLLFSMALLSLTASAYDYDYEPEAEGGDWAVGLNINQGTPNPVFNAGLGGKIQFYASRAFRLEASFNGWWPKTTNTLASRLSKKGKQSVVVYRAK